MEITADHVRVALLSLIAFVVSISVHEFGHAFVADRLGDRIPRLQGRLTLSPAAHIDPIGTILVPLLGAFLPHSFPLLAWGKPVQTSPNNYTRRLSMRTGHMLVAAAGPFMNLLLAVVGSVIFLVMGKLGWLSAGLATALVNYVLALNISLMFFNLLPIPPLDGGTVLAGLLPESFQVILRPLERYGMLLLFVMMYFGVINVLMRPAGALTSIWAGALYRLVSS
jgi:Zn-dependent protease